MAEKPEKPTRPPPISSLQLEAIEQTKTYDGTLLAKMPNTAVWKVEGKEGTLVSKGELAIIKTKVEKTSVIYLQFTPMIEVPKVEEPKDGEEEEETSEALVETSEVPPFNLSTHVAAEVQAEVDALFPLPLKDDLPVTKHSSVYFVFPTVNFSNSVFVGIKVDKNQEDYQKFVTALELSSEIIESKNLIQAKARASKIKELAATGVGLIKKASTVAGVGVGKVGSFLKTKIKSKETDTVMSENAKNTAKAVAVTAEKGVQISGMVVQMVGVMTKSMSEALVDGVQSQDSYQKLKGKIFKESKPPSANVQQAKAIGGSLIIGYSMLVDAMFEAAEIVLESAAATTVDVVGHRHGQAAADVTKDASKGAVDGVKTGLNLVKIGPKTVAKTAAKNAGTELLKDAL